MGRQSAGFGCQRAVDHPRATPPARGRYRRVGAVLQPSSSQIRPVPSSASPGPAKISAGPGGAGYAGRVAESFWLVIAGGLVGIVSSLIPLYLKRRWDAEDRRRVVDAKALEAAVHKMMAWQAFAVGALGSGETGPARERLIELDKSWEADFSLIPDQEAVQQILTMSRDIFFFSGWLREQPDAVERMDRLITLQDRAILSAQKKRRELA